MTDLADFLRARYGEIRRLAEATIERQPYDEWNAVGAGDKDDTARSIWEVVEIARVHHTPAAIDLARHIAQHDARYVIADIDAKLAVLDHYARLRHYAEVEGREPYILAEGAASVTLKLLAQPFAGHPDYQEEWRP